MYMYIHKRNGPHVHVSGDTTYLHCVFDLSVLHSPTVTSRLAQHLFFYGGGGLLFCDWLSAIVSLTRSEAIVICIIQVNILVSYNYIADLSLALAILVLSF